MWLKELKTHSSPDIKVFLIGNKVDLVDERKVTEEEAKKFKDDYMLNLKIMKMMKILIVMMIILIMMKIKVLVMIII